VPNSVITGNIAVSPISASAITGFSMTADASNTFSTSAQLTGKAYAADYAPTTPADLTTAVSDMETAYTDAAGRPNPDASRLNLGAGLLGGDLPGGPTAPLTPGVYTFGTDVNMGGNLHFSGSDTDIFILQTTGNVNVAANYQVILKGGALAKNIFWQVAGYVDVGPGAHVKGVILAKTSVKFKTEASLEGRILAQTAAVLQVATITQP
jgi:hypothetical protein